MVVPVVIVVPYDSRRKYPIIASLTWRFLGLCGAEDPVRTKRWRWNEDDALGCRAALDRSLGHVKYRAAVYGHVPLPACGYDAMVQHTNDVGIMRDDTVLSIPDVVHGSRHCAAATAQKRRVTDSRRERGD